MTVIAANLEMMVSDSRVTIGDGRFYPATKIIKTRDAIVGASGNGGDCTRFLEWAAGGWRTRPKFDSDGDDDELSGLVLRKDGIYHFSPSDPAPEKINAPFFAIGSGGKAAMVAMLKGATPEEAVGLVIEVDSYCGPPIQVIRISEIK